MSLYTYKAEILNVVDGDTVDVRIDLGLRVYHVTRLRLNGINAPELHSKIKAEVVRAKASRDRLIELINGKTVTVQTFKDRTEKYGRYLAEITLDGTSINQQMITEGLAVSYSGGKR
jgi:micrococcal nuclease